MEFGTNTGRQGTYDPRDPRQQRMAMQRLGQLEDEYGDRLQMGFTGETGLAKNDGQGWARMLNAQTEAANIKRIANGQGALRINEGGTMQSRSLPASMQALGMYDDDLRRRGEAEYAQASKAGWVPDEVRVEQARQRTAATDYAQNRARQSGALADQMEVDADPMQRRYNGLFDTATADQAFNESYGRRRGTGEQMADDATRQAVHRKTKEMDLELTHPLAALNRRDAAAQARMKASMEALGRVFDRPENFEMAGGLPGMARAAGQILGQGQDGEQAPPAAGQTAGVPAGQLNIQVPGVPDDISAELQAEMTRRGIPVNLKNIQTVYQRMVGAQAPQ